MWRVWVALTAVFLLLLVAVGLFTGILFQPLLRAAERSVKEHTPTTVTVGWARLSLGGEIVVSQLVLAKDGKTLLTVPQIVLDPRWSAFLKKKIVFDSATVDVENGSLKGKGTIGLRPLSVFLEGTTDRFPLDQLVRGVADIPSALRVAHTGHWSFTGNLPQWDFTLDGKIEHGVEASPTALRVSSQARFVGKKGRIDLVLGHGQSEVSANVDLDTEKKWMEADFEVKASPLSSFDVFWAELRQAQGSLVVTGRLGGPWLAPVGTVRLVGEGIFFKGAGAQSLQVAFERKNKGNPPFLLKVKASSLSWVNEAGMPGTLARADVQWAGALDRGDLQWSVGWDNGTTLAARGPARRNGPQMSWSWTDLKLTLPEGEEFSPVPGGSIDITPPDEIAVKDFQMGESDHSFYLRRFSFAKGVIDLDASARHFYLKIPYTPLAGQINGEVSLNGPWARPAGHFDVQISSGSYGKISALSGWAKGKIENGSVFVSDAGMGKDALPTLRVHGTLPWDWVTSTESDKAMDISVETGKLDPALFFKNNPNVMVGSGGFLNAKARVSGRKGALTGQGTVSGYLPHFEMTSYGITARETVVDIELEDRRLNVRKAETTLGKGTVRVSGGGDLPSLNLDVEGTQMSVAIRRKLELIADLRLHLRGTLAAPVLTGSLTFFEGTFEAAKKKKTEETTKEMNAALRRVWESLKMNIEAVWPNNMWYRDGLTKIDTGADLEIIKRAGDTSPGLRGSISVLKGNYDAFGRDFVIKSGELTFTDPSELDPQLNVQATHKMKNYLIELSVSGTFRKPELRFQSTPSLPEQDILALLALGKVPGQSASGGAGPEDTSSQAADLAADVVSNYLTREMRSAGLNVLDLDVVRVAPSEKGNEWTVGRYWGSKLFLSYSYIPEDAASQVLKAEYSLTPRWTFVGQTGSQSDNYLDLTFRLPVGKSRATKK
jgi:autotransporter translocation and assembly factor TamB